MCDIHFISKEEVTKHMDEVHVTVSQQLQDDDEDLIEAAEKQDLNDLYDQFVELMASQKDQESPEEIVEKIKRFKAILKKKDSIQKKAKVMLDNEIKTSKTLKKENKRLTNKVNPDNNCEELQNEVLTNQTKRLVERDNEVDKLKVHLNSAKKLNKKHGKDKKEHDAALERLIKDNGELTKYKQDLKFEIENKDSMIKSLKESLGVDDDNSEADQEEEHEEEQDDISEDIEATSVSMNKKTSGNKCTACDKTFQKNKDLENYMIAMHSQQQCLFNDKIFASETELVRHHTKCMQQAINTVTCPKCNNSFTNFALRRHTQQCKGNVSQYECSDCGKVGKTKEEIRKHINEVHAKQRVRSREVCYHWRRGNCTRGDSCGFSHVGHQDRSTSTTTQ